MNTCPNCGGTLEKGYLLDRDGKSSISRQARWARGELDSSLMGALFQRSVTQNVQDTLPVTTWRCLGCGKLESFALPEG